MFRRVAGVLAVIAFLTLMPLEAEARRKVGIPIPIPGLRGETIVKVLDLPKIPELRRKDGRFIDLGYKFNSWSGGDWIGYLGSDREFLPLQPEGLQAIMTVANLRELPDVPDRPWGFAEFLWILIGLVIAGGLVVNFLLKRMPIYEQAPTGWQDKVANGTPAGPAPRAAAPAASVRGGARASFGRRG